MTNYVNWMQTNMPIKGDVLQMQGNPVSDTVSPATGVATEVAPQGTHYAMVWSTVATQVQATELGGVSDGYQDKIVTIPANTILEIPNVQVGKTIIEMTDV